MADPMEAELLESARTGDRGAFGKLMRAHQRRVFACALHMLGDAGEAEDAAQETFLRAYRAIAKFDGRSELSTWLYRICINVSLNALRRRRRTEAHDLADPRVPEPQADPVQGQTDPRRSVEAAQFYALLARAVDTLSPSLRAAVVLVCIQGLAHKEAAEVLGCPEGTVAWRIHEARGRLREVLRDHLADHGVDTGAARGLDGKSAGAHAANPDDTVPGIEAPPIQGEDPDDEASDARRPS